MRFGTQLTKQGTRKSLVVETETLDFNVNQTDKIISISDSESDYLQSDEQCMSSDQDDRNIEDDMGSESSFVQMNTGMSLGSFQI